VIPAVAPAPDPGIASLRDPDGRVVRCDGRVLRLVNASSWPALESFLGSGTARSLVGAGKLIGSTVLDLPDREALLQRPELRSATKDFELGALLEHERVPFVSFPYEWPPEMLHAAGALTLDLAALLLDQGLGLKDATPHNVLFRGAAPVFVDLPSVERRVPGDPTWRPYAQFIRTFLLPLLVHRRFGLSPAELLLLRRDGIEPVDVYRLCGPLRRLLPPFLSLVTVPVWLGARQNPDDATVYAQRVWKNEARARFVLGRLLRGLRRRLDALAPAVSRRSSWSDYMAQGQNNYTERSRQAKEDFVNAALGEVRPRTVLDVGCNEGHFSLLAARRGARVVALDLDPVVVGALWRRAHAEGLDILPLVVNLSRPTPAMGWRNREGAAFLDRARAQFHCVFMLAVIHHMIVTEGLPLDDTLALAAELTTEAAIIEFVAPDDSMFRRLTRGRGALYTWLTRERFETACAAHFRIVRSEQPAGSRRRLYLLRKLDRAR
jgi:SAM-dependent methyltransferase